MKLISYHNKISPSISIVLLINLGSCNESIQESGIIHFIEHMLFKGTKNRTRVKLAQEIDELGGEFNAYTTKEYLCIYTTILKINVWNALDIITDIILHSSFDPDEVEKEKSVIVQEIDSYQDDSEELAFENFYSAAYLNQPMGRNILGNKSSVRNINSELLLKYFHQLFQPQNIYLSFAGDIENLNIKSFLKNKLPNKKIPFSNIVVNIAPPKFYAENTIYHVKNDLQTNFVIGFHAFDYHDIVRNYSVQILNMILGHGFSSRLFQKFREELAIVYNIGTVITSYKNTGVFKIFGACSIENLNFLLKHLYIEIRKITSLIHDNELERAKNLLKTTIVIAKETNLSIANSLIYEYSMFDMYLSTEYIFTILDSINKKQILEIAYSIFNSFPVYSVVGKKKINLTLFDL